MGTRPTVTAVGESPGPAHFGCGQQSWGGRAHGLFGSRFMQRWSCKLKSSSRALKRPLAVRLRYDFWCVYRRVEALSSAKPLRTTTMKSHFPRVREHDRGETRRVVIRTSQRTSPSADARGSRGMAHLGRRRAFRRPTRVRGEGPHSSLVYNTRRLGTRVHLARGPVPVHEPRPEPIDRATNRVDTPGCINIERKPPVTTTPTPSPSSNGGLR